MIESSDPNSMSFYCVLTDDLDQKKSFDVGFANGEFYTSKCEVDGNETGSVTVNAFISRLDVDLDAAAWGSIKDGGHLERFAREVVFGGKCLDAFLADVNGSRDSAEAWTDNKIQYPRLLAEIYATADLTSEQIESIAESMDLDTHEVHEIFIRAEKAFEKIKARAFQ